MAVALKNGALTTLSTLKDALGIAQTSTESDDALRRAINVATAAITKWCRRTFHREAFTDERYPATGGPRLVLNRKPLITLTSVALYQTTTPIDSSAYVVEDAAAGIVYFRYAIPSFRRRRPGIAQDGQPGSEPPDVLVTYEAGFVTPEQADVGGAFAGEPVTLPDDLEQAAIELAAHTYSTPIGFDGGEVQSEKLGDASVTYRDESVSGSIADKAIPSRIRAKLADYRMLIIV